MRKRIILGILISAMCCPLAFSSAPAISETPATISISGFKVSSSTNTSGGDNNAPRTVTIKGNYVSPSARDSVTLQLAIFGPIRTRSELANILKNSKISRGTVYSNVSTELVRVTPFTKVSWSLSFDAKKYLGTATNGVYGVGVVEQGTRVQESIPVPLFYGKNEVQPTKVVLLTQIAQLNTHLANGASQSLRADATNLTRIENIADLSAQVNWAVDPAVMQWVKDLQTTALSAQAETVLTKLESIRLTSNPTLYSHINLKSLIKQKPTDVSTVIARSNATSSRPALYIPSNGELGYQTLDALKSEKAIIPIVTNEFVYGGELQTSSAHLLINDASVLVIDGGANQCFSEPTRFKIVTCLQATIAMMTAQSPNVSRTVLVTTPTLWSPKPGDVKAISDSLTNQTWGQRIPITEALTSPAVRIYRQLYAGNQSEIDQALINRGDRLVQKARVLGTAFNSAEFTQSYVDVQLRSYSALWSKENSALRFIRANDAALEASRARISIQSSSRVTIANSKTEVPITVANQNGYPLTVNIVLTSKSKSRFTAKTSNFVTIQPNQRVTVPIKIELTGTGSVEVTARLKNLDGQYLGITKTMQIASSAYQSIARTLVWGAFGLLILLAILNRLRKQRKSEVAEMESDVATDDSTLE